MNILVDTSVWSLASRRAPAPPAPEELLQGFQGPTAARRIVKEFSLLPVLAPEIEDHIEAAALRNHCRRRGVQVGSIAALLAQLCLRHGLRLLTADRDFEAMARHCPLVLLRPS